MNLHTSIPSYVLHTTFDYGASGDMPHVRVDADGNTRVTATGDTRVVLDVGVSIVLHAKKETLILHTEI